MTSEPSEHVAPNAIRQSRISPDYLHGNSMVHTWVFSAIAELIDNSYDANSKELKLDIEEINGYRCLTFADNGHGMDAKELDDMMSLGFCTKFYQGRHQVGQFGNGFKSGSMRLGDSAVVFTRCEEDGRHKASACVGMLSQTYLKKIKATTVQVPMLEYTVPDLISDRHAENDLKAILRHSPYKDKGTLKKELRKLRTNGTKIVIFELKRLSDGTDELDFNTDPEDVICPHEEGTPRNKYSLREYCSILFLRPRMKIILRGKKVKTELITSSLSNPWTCSYQATGRAKTKITFGHSWEANAASDYYGMMLYHNNRLITAFEKLRLQRNALRPEGIGVVGVTQANFLDPIHTKQDFIRDKKYELAMSAYNQKLKEYLEYVESQPASTVSQNWVRCDYCRKWRKLPKDYNTNELPEKWYCHMNPDIDHNDCTTEEEDEKEVPKTKRATRRSGDQFPSEADLGEYRKLQDIKTEMKSVEEETSPARPKRTQTPLKLKRPSNDDGSTQGKGSPSDHDGLEPNDNSVSLHFESFAKRQKICSQEEDPRPTSNQVKIEPVSSSSHDTAGYSSGALPTTLLTTLLQQKAVATSSSQDTEGLQTAIEAAHNANADEHNALEQSNNSLSQCIERVTQMPRICCQQDPHSSSDDPHEVIQADLAALDVLHNTTDCASDPPSTMLPPHKEKGSFSLEVTDALLDPPDALQDSGMGAIDENDNHVEKKSEVSSVTDSSLSEEKSHTSEQRVTTAEQSLITSIIDSKERYDRIEPQGNLGSRRVQDQVATVVDPDQFAQTAKTFSDAESQTDLKGIESSDKDKMIADLRRENTQLSIRLNKITERLNENLHNFHRLLGYIAPQIPLGGVDEVERLVSGLIEEMNEAS